ncbi:MAG: DUF4911 domain-containing protein [Bdellovibrionota bacterium]
MTTTRNSPKLGPALKTIRRVFRVRKDDSAFVYCILEAHEGITSYSTLKHKTGDPHRDLELGISPDFQEDVERVIQSLGEMVYEITDSGA